MDLTKRLIKAKKSLQKARDSFDKLEKKLEKKERKIQLKICKSEKEKARLDRVCFINNIQLSNVHSLLKRKRDEATDEDSLRATREMREYLFSTEDVFKQIVAHLGPTEYYMFSRTNKSIATQLLSTFKPWATLFIERLQKETHRPMIFRNCEARLSPLIKKFASIIKDKEAALSALPRCLSLIQEGFTTYRPYNSLKASLLSYPSFHLALDSHFQTIFLKDKQTNVITRASEHNLLSGRGFYNKTVQDCLHNFRARHRFELVDHLEKDETLIEYFRYEELNNLQLHRLSHTIESHCRGLYTISVEDAEILCHLASKKFEIYALATNRHYPLSNFLLDEYECHSLLLQKEEFKPKYASLSMVNESLDIALASLLSLSTK